MPLNSVKMNVSPNKICLVYSFDYEKKNLKWIIKDSCFKFVFTFKWFLYKYNYQKCCHNYVNHVFSLLILAKVEMFIKNG